MPLFLAIEGIDGSGKTTTMGEIERFLLSRGHVVHRTAEPTGYEIGRTIRSLLTCKQERAFLHHELALLFAADRLRHLAEEIEPALAAGKTVISDRYLFSSLAYQSVRLPYEWVKELNRFARLPDIVIYIEVSIETALSRITRFREGVEIFETRDFLGKLTTHYDHILTEYADRVTIVRMSGEVAMEEIAAEVERSLSKIFPLTNKRI